MSNYRHNNPDGAGFPYGEQPPSQSYPSAPYGAPPPPGQSSPYAPVPSPYGAPSGAPNQSYGGYPPSAYGNPFAALTPSPFPPGTDPNVIACFQVADQDESGFIDDEKLQRALSSYNQSFSLRTLHLLSHYFANTNTRNIAYPFSNMSNYRHHNRAGGGYPNPYGAPPPQGPGQSSPYAATPPPLAPPGAPNQSYGAYPPSPGNMRMVSGDNLYTAIEGGDGTYDAPALHDADIGLSMGIAGTEVAKESADVTVLDDNFSTIVNVARWGRSAHISIQRFVQFQLTANIIALTFNFLSACASGSAPLTAVQLLWVNLIMHAFNTLALANEPSNDGLLLRRRDESFITSTMRRNIFGQSIYQMAVLLVLTCVGKKMLGLTGSNATAVQNTFIFNTFVFCQVFNEISGRDIDKSNIFRGLIGNWIFLGLIAAIVVLQVIIVEFLDAFASTVPLNWQLWLLSIVLGAVSMPIAVVLKYIPVNYEAIAAQHEDCDPLTTDPELA